MIGKTNIPMGMSKGETVSILLKTNQSSNEDLNGVKVVVSYDDESHEYTYNGQFSVKIPKDKTYTVTFGEVGGYKTPSSVTYTAVQGFSRSVEVMYYSEFLTINVTNDSGSINDFELTIFKQETVGVATKYTRLEYIESTGTQYIDTGFKPKNTTRVLLDTELLSLPSSWAMVMGSYESGASYAWGTKGSKIYAYYGSENKNGSIGVGRIVLDSNKTSWKYGSNTLSLTDQTFSSQYNLYICNISNRTYEKASMKVYSCQIYDNGVLIRDYIPALRSDGIAGLYDAVNDVFYSSSGTADFEYGVIKDVVIATQTFNSKLHKIAYDTEYLIEASNVSGFVTPETQRYTANQPSRTISMEYTKSAEHLVVNVSSDDNAVSGYEINIFKPEYIGENNEYLKLDYIESTGEQWIDTGYTLATVGNRLEYDVQFTSTKGGYSGFYLPNQNLAFGVNGSLEFYLGSSFKSVSSNVTERNSIVLDVVKGEALLNNSSIITDANFVPPNNTLPIFALMRSSGVDICAYMKMYSFKIYENNVLLRSYIPVMRMSDGIVGLYEELDGEFLYSETDVNFKAGFEERVIGTQTSATGEYDIPLGTEYMITASDVNGYITPASQTFTAESGTRTVDMVYEAVKLGVYIQGVSGKLYKTDAWTNQETPNGIAVLTEECSFVIALEEASSAMRLSNSSNTELENYMTAISDETQAKADYDGVTNTANIMKLQSGTGYAAGWCNAFSFPSGKKGFLPSLGQMWAAYSNKAAVDAALTKAGGTAFTLTQYYWTSTFYGMINGYRDCWLLNWKSGNVNKYRVDLMRQVRAFSDL